MNEVASIINPGLLCTVQDFGRKGYRKYGIPSSGAMDIVSLANCNKLVGNSANYPALEIIGGNFAARILQDTELAVTGADSEITIDGEKTEANRTIRAKEGSLLRIRYLRSGMINYLSCKGGFLAENALGSFSTYAAADIGGKKVKQGDTLYSASLKSSEEHPEALSSLQHVSEFRAIKGLQHDILADLVAEFFQQTYTVSTLANRMGYRLEGKPLRIPLEIANIISFPVVPGMIQLLPDGKAVVLFPDCQTTGGYPIVAMVIQPDASYLSQLSPGEQLKFRMIDEEESFKIIRDFYLSLF
ncbi:MAG: biotin-dependent carboxyltransferase family protein [Nitrososphaerota archaeon]